MVKHVGFSVPPDRYHSVIMFDHILFTSDEVSTMTMKAKVRDREAKLVTLGGHYVTLGDHTHISTACTSILTRPSVSCSKIPTSEK